MSEIEYDAEMVGAFIAPRPGEYVPSQYAHDLAHMAFNLNVRLAQRDGELEALRGLARNVIDSQDAAMQHPVTEDKIRASMNAVAALRAALSDPESPALTDKEA